MHVLAHDLSGIDLLLRIDEEASAVLELVDGVGEGSTRLHGNHGTVGASFDVALVGLVLLEAVRHDGFAGRCREDVRTQSDDAARGDVELDVDPVADGLHRRQLALASGDHINHLAGVFLGDVDGQLLDGLTLLAVNLLVDDLRLSHLKLIAFATHGLDEDGEVQHASAGDNPLAVLVLGLADAEGKVLVELAGEAVLDVA